MLNLSQNKKNPPDARCPPTQRGGGGPLLLAARRRREEAAALLLLAARHRRDEAPTLLLLPARRRPTSPPAVDSARRRRPGPAPRRPRTLLRAATACSPLPYLQGKRGEARLGAVVRRGGEGHRTGSRRRRGKEQRGKGKGRRRRPGGSGGRVTTARSSGGRPNPGAQPPTRARVTRPAKQGRVLRAAARTRGEARPRRSASGLGPQDSGPRPRWLAPVVKLAVGAKLALTGAHRG